MSLLRVNDHAPLLLEGRDGIIRKCIDNHFDIYDTAEELKKHGYQETIK